MAKSDGVPQDNAGPPEDNADPKSPESPACPDSSDSVETRADRLARIRADVDAGRYDSDEMLERALEIMLRKMADDTE